MYCVETCYSKVLSTEGLFKELLWNMDKLFMIYELGKFRHFLKWGIPLALLQRKRWFLLIIRFGGKTRTLLSVSYSHFRGTWEKQRYSNFPFFFLGQEILRVAFFPTFRVITKGKLWCYFFQINAVNCYSNTYETVSFYIKSVSSK